MSSLESRLGKHIDCPPKETLDDLYTNQRKSTHEIGRMYGVYNGTVIRWLHNYNIELRAGPESQINEKGAIVITKDLLHRLYILEDKTPKQISAEIRRPYPTVMSYINRYGLNKDKSHH